MLATVIYYCEKELTDIEELAKVGYKFYQPQTRWQIANLLGNTELDSRVQFIENRIQYLEKMAEHDTYEYARRRARVNLKKVLEFELEQKKAYERRNFLKLLFLAFFLSSLNYYKIEF
jgi:hypothetical protein